MKRFAKELMVIARSMAADGGQLSDAQLDDVLKKTAKEMTDIAESVVSILKSYYDGSDFKTPKVTVKKNQDSFYNISVVDLELSAIGGGFHLFISKNIYAETGNISTKITFMDGKKTYRMGTSDRESATDTSIVHFIATSVKQNESEFEAFGTGGFEGDEKEKFDASGKILTGIAKLTMQLMKREYPTVKFDAITKPYIERGLSYHRVLVILKSSRGQIYFRCTFPKNGDKQTVTADLYVDMQSSGLWTSDKYPTPKAIMSAIADVLPSIPSEAEAFGGKGQDTDYQEQFEWHGFKVFNTGLRENQMRKVLSAYDGVFRRFKQKGFGKLLYGPLFIVGGDLKGKVFEEKRQEYKDVNAAALYYPDKDFVVINARHSANPSMIAHELGHRNWYRFLTQAQREMWEGNFSDRSVSLNAKTIMMLKEIFTKSCPQDALKESDIPAELKEEFSFVKNRGHLTFPRFDKFNYATFERSVKNLQNRYMLWDALTIIAKAKGDDGVEKYIKKYIKFYKPMVLELLDHKKRIQDFPNAEDTKDIEDAPKPEVRREVLTRRMASMWENRLSSLVYLNIFEVPSSMYGKDLKPMVGQSEYGNSNTREDYAECFAAYMTNNGMPEELYDLFMRVHGLRTSSKQASVLLKLAKELLASKPIPVDKPAIKQLARNLSSNIKRFLQSHDANQIIGKKELATESQELNFIQGKKLNVSVTVKSVTGNFKQLVLGGHQDGAFETSKRIPEALMLDISIAVNGSVMPMEYLKSTTLTDDLYSMLLHEFTHAMDLSGIVNQKVNDVSTDTGLTEYYNQPREVRAYLQQIIDEVQKVIPAIIKQYANRHKLMDEVLKRSFTWNKFKDRWNHESKKKIMQAVYHEVDINVDAAEAGF